MLRLAIKVLFGHWVFQFLGAAALALLAWFSYTGGQERALRLDAMAKAAAPAAVDLEQFAFDEGKGAEQEVSLIATVATDFNTRIVRKAGAESPSDTVIYFLMAASVSGTERRARAALLLRADEVDKFAEWALENAVSFNELGPIIQIGGLASPYDGQKSEVRDALRERGLKATPAFLYIEPFLNGREADLAALAAKSRTQTPAALFWAIALLLVIGCGNLSFGLVMGRAKKKDDLERGPLPSLDDWAPAAPPPVADTAPAMDLRALRQARMQPVDDVPMAIYRPTLGEADDEPEAAPPAAAVTPRRPSLADSDPFERMQKRQAARTRAATQLIGFGS